MKELLELFCFVSMGTQYVPVRVCVCACVVGGGVFIPAIQVNKRARVSMVSIVALLKRSMHSSDLWLWSSEIDGFASWMNCEAC